MSVIDNTPNAEVLEQELEWFCYIPEAVSIDASATGFLGYKTPGGLISD